MHLVLTELIHILIYRRKITKNLEWWGLLFKNDLLI